MSKVCPSCGVKFTNEPLLQRHLKISTKCSPKFECDYCSYSTTALFNLRRHLNTCKMKIIIDEEEKETSRDNEINSLIIDYEVKLTLKDEEINTIRISKDKEIDTLKTQLDTLKTQLDIAQKKIKTFKKEVTDLNLQLAEKKGMLSVKQGPRTTTTINNNVINQKLLKIKCSTIDPFTVDTVQKAIDAGGYTFSRFRQGAAGIADFILDITCTDDGQRNYACSDFARNKCHRLIETRDWEADNGARFIKRVLDQLKEPTLVHHQYVVDQMMNRETEEKGNALRELTRRTVNGIMNSDSEEREEIFNKIRTKVKQLTTV